MTKNTSRCSSIVHHDGEDLGLVHGLDDEGRLVAGHHLPVAAGKEDEDRSVVRKIRPEDVDLLAVRVPVRNPETGRDRSGPDSLALFGHEPDVLLDDVIGGHPVAELARAVELVEVLEPEMFLFLI